MKPSRINFRCTSGTRHPSDHACTVLGEIARNARIPSVLTIVLTSTERTEREQAQAMLDHVLAPMGLDGALKLYAAGGDTVISAMHEAIEHGLGRESVLDFGEDAVRRAEAAGFVVSRHRPNALVEAIDISRRSLGLHLDAFAKHAMGHPQVRKVVHDNALHIEVYKPGRRA